MMFSAAISVAAESGCIRGDVDGNGEIEVTDATWIQRHVAMINIPFTLKSLSADIDGDGTVSMMDATLVQRWLAHLESNDRIGERIIETTKPTQDEYELPVH